MNIKPIKRHFVSVSLQSIIHSYEYERFIFQKSWSKGFRLLTEYHSFLLIMRKYRVMESRLKFPSPYGVSFILIFLIKRENIDYSISLFPSPYGVSFILIGKIKFNIQTRKTAFPSPYGVSFILIKINID